MSSQVFQALQEIAKKHPTTKPFFKNLLVLQIFLTTGCFLLKHPFFEKVVFYQFLEPRFFALGCGLLWINLALVSGVALFFLRRGIFSPVLMVMVVFLKLLFLLVFPLLILFVGGAAGINLLVGYATFIPAALLLAIFPRFI
ncbi:MAG TPA: hypothetical protein PKD37_02815 [Oligoflexia bacterium]|nr:hypothetical protein [Oligoflexia bacterium]HMP26898.1 hypothetical protein [Oligoflexia bacterium]